MDLTRTKKKLTSRQKEVLLAYAGVDEGIPSEIKKWIDGAPNHQKWGCRLNGVCNVIYRLRGMGLLWLMHGKPTVHAVQLTDEGRLLAGELTKEIG